MYSYAARKKLAIPLWTALFLFSFSCSSSLALFFRFIERSLAGLSEKSVQVGDHKIAYLEGGTGESVLLLHGFGADKDNWDRFARYLTKKYHVVAPDLPGFGESSRIKTDRYDIFSQVVRLHEFAHTIGLKKFHCAGNSMGGNIAGVYASFYFGDVLSLGLFDSGGVKSPFPSELSIDLKKGYNPLIVGSTADYDKLLDFVFVKKPHIPGSVKSYLADMAIHNRDFNQKIFREINTGLQLGNRMRWIRARTLILWGGTDRVLNVSGAWVLRRAIRNSKIVIMKKCGHLPMVERPDEAAKYYLTFITQP
jgi:abhydrolase domain-containing protein 6